VSAPATLTRRTPVHEPPAEGLGLLLDLMAVPEGTPDAEDRGPGAHRPGTHRPGTHRRGAHRPSAHRPGLREQVHTWIRRAAAWGSGPGGAFRAW